MNLSLNAPPCSDMVAQESSAFLVGKSNDVANVARAATLTTIHPTPVLLFAEDLILAEDRTTERDRKKITEGELSAGGGHQEARKVWQN